MWVHEKIHEHFHPQMCDFKSSTLKTSTPKMPSTFISQIKTMRHTCHWTDSFCVKGDKGNTQFIKVSLQNLLKLFVSNYFKLDHFSVWYHVDDFCPWHIWNCFQIYLLFISFLLFMRKFILRTITSPEKKSFTYENDLTPALYSRNRIMSFCNFPDHQNTCYLADI